MILSYLAIHNETLAKLSPQILNINYCTVIITVKLKRVVFYFGFAVLDVVRIKGTASCNVFLDIIRMQHIVTW
jgi:hypothetical protein